MTNSKQHFLAAMSLLAVIAITVSACTEDYFDMDKLDDDLFVWNPDLAIPLVFSSLTAADIISNDENNYYQYGDDTFITLVYTRTVFSETLNEFLAIDQNQSVQQPISLNSMEVNDFTTSGQTQKIVNADFAMVFNGVTGSQLDNVIFDSGTMTIGLLSDFQHSGSLLVSMPELTLNGVPFSQSIPINYTGGLVNQSIAINMQGYQLDLNSGGGTNSAPITYTLSLINGGGGVSEANAVSVTHGFSDLVMRFADGYFGQFELDIPGGTVQLDLLENGVLYFEDPRLRLNVTNSIGVPIQVTVQDFYFDGASGPATFDFSDVMGNPFTIQGAPAVGQSSQQSFYFTRDNSNITPLVNGNHSTLVHDFDAIVNGGGQTYNFASRNSVVEVVAEAELPFWGKANHYIVHDTLENPLGELGLQENIENGMLRVSTLNGFPMDGILKLYLTDSLYNVVDSLLADGSYILRSGPLDANGKVISPVSTSKDIEIDAARVESLFGTKYIIVHADITSSEDATVNMRIYGSDRLQVNIGLQVKLKGSPNDL